MFFIKCYWLYTDFVLSFIFFNCLLLLQSHFHYSCKVLLTLFSISNFVLIVKQSLTIRLLLMHHVATLAAQPEKGVKKRSPGQSQDDTAWLKHGKWHEWLVKIMHRFGSMSLGDMEKRTLSDSTLWEFIFLTSMPQGRDKIYHLIQDWEVIWSTETAALTLSVWLQHPRAKTYLK